MISYDGPHLKLYDRVLDHELNNPPGMVGRHMKTIGVKILVGAKAMVGVRSRALRTSIRMSHARDTRGQYVTVGSDLNYAYVHHEGSRPHVSTPKTGRVLRFRSGGRVVYARKVNHPGFRGRKYLTIPMRRAVR